MEDRKDLGENGAAPPEATPPDGDAVPESFDPASDDGWQQYRRWISKAPSPRRRRPGLDPSLYTWKGYRNWAKQVKRNWSSES